MKSPVISACSPFDWIITLTWPGVWPKVGVKVISSHIRSFVSTMVARPASMIGVTESARMSAMSGTRKRRHPFAIDQTRIPPDMIDMKMGAQHRIDRLRREAGVGKIGQERPIAVVPVRNPPPLLIVAQTGVDNDAPIRRFHDEAVDAHAQPAVFIGEM